MSDEDWQTSYAKAVGVFLNGNAIPSPTAKGERIIDESFCVLFNAHWDPIEFTLPEKWSNTWTKILDTAANGECSTAVAPGERVQVVARSVVVVQSAD